MYAQAGPEQAGPKAQGATQGEAAAESEKSEQAEDADFEVVEDKDEKKK
jgi:hypothetical protein